MKKPNRYVIANTETHKFLAAIQIGRTPAIHPLHWTDFSQNAIHFENSEEAQATITFIGAVLDWELEEQLEIYGINI